MVNINRVDVGPAPAQVNPQAPVTTTPAKTTKVDAPVDVTERSSATIAQRSVADLGPVPLPKVEGALTGFASSESFGTQLEAMGGPATSSEDLLSKFLKLQMLGGTWDLINQYLAGEGFSILRKHAYELMKNSNTSRIDSLRSQADNLEQQAETLMNETLKDANDKANAAAARAQDLYNQAAAKREQANACTDQTEAEALRTEAANLEQQAQAELDGASGEVTDAQRQSLTRAGALYAQAGALRDEAGALANGAVSGLAVTATVRKGADAMNSQLRNQDYLKDLQKKLRELLDRDRADKRALAEAIHQMEQSRIEVAKLLLNLIDKANAASAAASRSRG
jgi:hypothetical protein